MPSSVGFGVVLLYLSVFVWGTWLEEEKVELCNLTQAMPKVRLRRSVSKWDGGMRGHSNSGLTFDSTAYRRIGESVCRLETLSFLSVVLCCDFTPAPQRIRCSLLLLGVYAGYLGLPGSGPWVCRWNVSLDKWGNLLCCCWFSSLPWLSLLLPLSLGSFFKLPARHSELNIHFWITSGFFLGSLLLAGFFFFF